MDKVELFIRDRALLYLKKNKDYGDSFNKSLDKYGDVAFLVRAEDKINRVQTLLNKREDVEVKDERILDTILDLFNYIVMYDMYTEGSILLAGFIETYCYYIINDFLNLDKILAELLGVSKELRDEVIGEVAKYIDRLE